MNQLGLSYWVYPALHNPWTSLLSVNTLQIIQILMNWIKYHTQVWAILVVLTLLGNHKILAVVLLSLHMEVFLDHLEKVIQNVAFKMHKGHQKTISLSATLTDLNLVAKWVSLIFWDLQNNQAKTFSIWLRTKQSFRDINRIQVYVTFKFLRIINLIPKNKAKFNPEVDLNCLTHKSLFITR